jgi:hypothetical protein
MTEISTNEWKEKGKSLESEVEVRTAVAETVLAFRR